MSFFRSSGNSNQTPPPNPSYNRIPQYNDGSDSGLPPRSVRRPAPPSAQFAPPQNGYNDPSGALFEKGGYSQRKPPPSRSGGRYLAIVLCALYLLLKTNDAQFLRRAVSKRSTCINKLSDRSSIGLSSRTARPGKWSLYLDRPVRQALVYSTSRQLSIEQS